MKPNPEIESILRRQSPRRKRPLWPIVVGLLTLLVALAMAWCARPAFAEECPSTAPSRIPGFGYTPPPGSLSCLWTEQNRGGSSRCYPMDLSAHPFGTGPNETLDFQAALRRYGPNFHGTDTTMPRFLATDFEDIFGIAARYMSDLCCANAFGTAATHTCISEPASGKWHTVEQVHDYIAVTGTALRAGGPAAATPGVPRIMRLSSPGPGVVEIAWKTRIHDEFEVKAGTVTETVAGDVFAAVLQLPPGEGGEITVTVAAFLGGKGRASLVRTIMVEPRTSIPEPPPQPQEPPLEPPGPEPCPTCPACPECPTCDTECPGQLASATESLGAALVDVDRLRAELGRLQAELAVVRADLERFESLPPITVPPRVWETLQLQQEIGRVQGTGMRQRAREVRAWICGKVAPAAPECRP